MLATSLNYLPYSNPELSLAVEPYNWFSCFGDMRSYPKPNPIECYQNRTTSRGEDLQEFIPTIRTTAAILLQVKQFRSVLTSYA